MTCDHLTCDTREDHVTCDHLTCDTGEDHVSIDMLVVGILEVM